MRVTPTIEDWITQLRTVAAPVLSGDVVLPAVDVSQAVAGVIDHSGVAVESQVFEVTSPKPEIALWLARRDSFIDVQAQIASPTDGSLLPRDLYSAIEVWTDADLCALHALWALAEDHDRDDWRDRCARVSDWHLEHTQPDNATNRPWALHVFLLSERSEGRFYAETLLHNCQATTGRPDVLSALILLDAASLLESASE